MNTSVYSEVQAIHRFWLIWCSLASQDIKLRYRRSVLGPLWITIGTAVTIYTTGFLYGNLFHIQLDHYFPYLASGIIGWAFISILIQESCNVFIEAENYIKNQESHMSLFMMRLISRNCLVFLHNLLVLIPIVLIYKTGIGLKTLLIIPGLAIIAVNAFCLGTVLGILGTRYRDFTQIITSLMQVVFFLTPIMWMPSALSPNHQWLVNYNPFNHFLNLIRYPLMQETWPTYSVWVILLITSFSVFLYRTFVKKYKHRIVFWL